MNCCLFLAASVSLWGQILTTDPTFPTQNDQVTIYFDATQGAGGLANCNCDVYLHTGVITNQSTGTSDWKHVVTTWGQANAAWKMTPVAGQPNKYSYVIGPSVRSYYGIPQGEDALKLAFVFRNADGSKEGKGTGNTDIFYDLYPEGTGLTTNLLSPSGSNMDVALGQTIPVNGAASIASNLFLYDNGELIAQASNSSSLNHDIYADESGSHLVQFIAVNGTASDTASFTYQASLKAAFSQPAGNFLIVNPGQQISVAGTAYIPADLRLLDNGVEVAAAGNSATVSFNFTANGAIHQIDLEATYNGETVTRSLVYLSTSQLGTQNPPQTYRDGVTYLSDTSVFLQLHCPNKAVTMVLGDFNDWQPKADFVMKKGNDGATYWLQVNGLEPGRNYTFQYLVDGNIKVADPHSTVVLDPDQDPYIPAVTYPDLPPYPAGKTTGIVTLIQPGAAPYEWQSNDYQAPEKKDLVIYELLIRDFIGRHDYQTLKDTLDYLQRLGITAIELMPVSEFEGNLSWGYNPSFHQALDKYYGPIPDFKAFIDECHSRGIAVILDVVFNHAFSQSPLAQLFWDPVNFRPTAANPWLNPTARHPFNVGYDFNHESPATKRYVDQILEYWLEEFRVDGFRFDLSKGFTQKFNTDVGAWGQYDASRIAILKHYADVIWNVNPSAYTILEHFAENSEETELINYGMMSWGGGGIQNQYLEGSLGYASDLTGSSYTSRGWTLPHLIPYMESHDEERMMYKNENFGNSSGNYNVKDFITGLRRAELAATFFYPLPGPKMLWQFGELGYDYSINTCEDGSISNDCRLSNKPIRWDYYQSPSRRKLFETVRSLIYLKTHYPVFKTEDFDLFLSASTKRIFLHSNDMEVAIQGNFGVTAANITSAFPETGWWYEYFTGDSLMVENTALALNFAPGEYRLYTNVRLDAPPGGYVGTTEVVRDFFGLQMAPNPASGPVNIRFSLPVAGETRIEIYNLNGQLTDVPLSGKLPGGEHRITWSEKVVPGVYVVQLWVGNKVEIGQLVVGK